MKCDYCMGSGEAQDAKELGGNIRRLRVAKGVPMREFARSIGISHTYLCQLENGTRRWRLELLNRCYRQLKRKT